MVSDANKGITGITYNHLNLPTTIGTDSGNISYVYDAMGIKLEKTVSVGSSVTSYAGNYVYQNSVLQFMSHPEGYATPNGMGGYDYVYQYKDHLGNIRLSYTDDPSNPGTPTIIEESNYYPFGLKHKGYNGSTSPLGNDVAQKWKFGGKEYEDGFNESIATYDFGARNYDPALGRWMSIDPLTEEMRRHSPYNYAFDNPVYFIDPDGMKPCPPGVDCPEEDLPSSDNGQHQDYRPIPIGDGTASNTTDNDVNEVEEPTLSFKEGDKVEMKVTNRNWGEVTAGPLSAGYNELEIEYNGETIKSGGITTGGGLGTEFLTKTGGVEVEFFTDMEGNSMEEVFNQTGLTIEKSFGAVLSFGTITGYDSANKMNKQWSVKVRGTGLKGGVSSTRSTQPFKKQGEKNE